MADIEQAHGFGDDGNEVGRVNAHDLRPGSGWVGKRAKHIEDGADAQRPANGHNCLHGRLQAGRMEESEAVSAKRGYCIRRCEGDGNPEGLEDVGRSACRGDRAVAVFGHDHSVRGSGCGGNQGRGGGDVEGAAGVAAGTAGIDQQATLRLGQRHRGCGGTHDVDKAGKLCGMLSARGDGSKQRS